MCSRDGRLGDRDILACVCMRFESCAVLVLQFRLSLLCVGHSHLGMSSTRALIVCSVCLGAIDLECRRRCGLRGSVEPKCSPLWYNVFVVRCYFVVC